MTAHQTDLVRANEEFYAWISGDKTMPFGDNNRHVPVRLIYFDQLDHNRFVVTNLHDLRRRGRPGLPAQVFHRRRDKSMHAHTLLQAIAQVNRPYEKGGRERSAGDGSVENLLASGFTKMISVLSRLRIFSI